MAVPGVIDASFVLVTEHVTLTECRTLEAGPGVTLIDGGPGAALTMGIGFSGEATGDMIRRGDTNWELLPAGTTNQIMQHDGTDPSWVDPRTITLDQLSPPAGAVDFNEQQAVALVLENRTDDPVSPASGRMFMRIDL